MDILSFIVTTSRLENCLFNRRIEHIFNLILLTLSRRVRVGRHHPSWVVVMLNLNRSTFVKEMWRLISRVSRWQIASQTEFHRVVTATSSGGLGLGRFRVREHLVVEESHIRRTWLSTVRTVLV